MIFPCLIGCIDEIRLKIDDDNKSLAIEGLISDIFDTYQIRVHYSAVIGVGNDNVLEPISGAQVQAGIIQTRLNDDTTLANVRRGPGPEFEIMGTVSNQATIEVIGRAKDSYWLQIEWQGQTGWLAGDLIADQDLLPTLPTVESAAVVAVTTPQPVNTDGWLCLGQIVRGFGTAWDNHPEIRPLLGCPFTDFRQGEHATGGGAITSGLPTSLTHELISNTTIAQSKKENLFIDKYRSSFGVLSIFNRYIILSFTNIFQW
jgi:hypothetical protein